MDENEELNNIITLNDEDGKEVQFEFLDLIEYNEEEYVILLPIEETDDEEAGEVVILKVEHTESEDEESYIGVEDEDELNAVFAIFKDKFKDEFNFIDEDQKQKGDQWSPLKLKKPLKTFKIGLKPINNPTSSKPVTFKITPIIPTRANQNVKDFIDFFI